MKSVSLMKKGDKVKEEGPHQLTRLRHAKSKPIIVDNKLSPSAQDIDMVDAIKRLMAKGMGKGYSKTISKAGLVASTGVMREVVEVWESSMVKWPWLMLNSLSLLEALGQLGMLVDSIWDEMVEAREVVLSGCAYTSPTNH